MRKTEVELRRAAIGEIVQQNEMVAEAFRKRDELRALLEGPRVQKELNEFNKTFAENVVPRSVAEQALKQTHDPASYGL